MKSALVVVVALAGAAHADAPSASQVLARAERTPELAARFRARVTDAQTGATEVREGTVLAVRDKLRIDYQRRRSVDASHVFDGTTAWTIEHRRRSIASSPAPDVAWHEALAFVVRPGLAARYTVSFDPSSTRDAHVLTLVPQHRGAITRLVVVVDPHDARVMTAVVTEASGRIHDVRFDAAPLVPKPRNFVVTPSALRGYAYTPAPPPIRPVAPAPTNPTPAPPPTRP